MPQAGVPAPSRGLRNANAPHSQLPSPLRDTLQACTRPAATASTHEIAFGKHTSAVTRASTVFQPPSLSRPPIARQRRIHAVPLYTASREPLKTRASSPASSGQPGETRPPPSRKLPAARRDGASPRDGSLPLSPLPRPPLSTSPAPDALKIGRAEGIVSHPVDQTPLARPAGRYIPRKHCATVSQSSRASAPASRKKIAPSTDVST